MGDIERQVGRADPLAQAAGESHADHFGHAHHHRHAEHHAFGLQPADAPAQHADAIDHRRVAVGADQRVGHRPAHAVARLARHHRGQPLEVDGVHDAGAGRVHGEIVEHARRPFHEAVALGIARHLARHVVRTRLGAAINIDRKAVIGRDVDRQHGVEYRGIATSLGQCRSRGGDIDQRRAAGRIMHHHAAGQEGDLGVAVPGGDPALDDGARLRIVIASAQQVFEQDAVHDRQARKAQRGEVDDREAGAGAVELACREHHASPVRGEIGAFSTMTKATKVSPARNTRPVAGAPLDLAITPTA